MAYPTVPDFQPFQPCATPNLTAGGPYDTMLTEIEEYLASLGGYVDDADNALIGRVSSVETGLQTVTADLDTAEATLEGLVTDIDDLEERVTSIEASGGSGYVLPQATPEVLGGVYTASDEDFIAYMGLV